MPAHINPASESRVHMSVSILIITSLAFHSFRLCAVKKEERLVVFAMTVFFAAFPKRFCTGTKSRKTKTQAKSIV